MIKPPHPSTSHWPRPCGTHARTEPTRGLGNRAEQAQGPVEEGAWRRAPSASTSLKPCKTSHHTVPVIGGGEKIEAWLVFAGRGARAGADGIVSRQTSIGFRSCGNIRYNSDILLGFLSSRVVPAVDLPSDAAVQRPGHQRNTGCPQETEQNKPFHSQSWSPAGCEGASQGSHVIIPGRRSKAMPLTVVIKCPEESDMDRFCKSRIFPSSELRYRRDKPPKRVSPIVGRASSWMELRPRDFLYCPRALYLSFNWTNVRGDMD